MFGPRSDEVTGGWRKLYNEELNNLYSSTNTIRIFKERIKIDVIYINVNRYLLQTSIIVYEKRKPGYCLMAGR
jgi:hypothetical protein